MILDKIFKRKYVETNNGQSEEEKSDRDSGKGESDHDTINPAGGPKCDENCLRLGMLKFKPPPGVALCNLKIILRTF